jgi:ABC-type multidrug transport system fused ATPase/permease subunit
MTRTQLQLFYNERLASFRTQSAAVKKRIHIIANFRLIVAVLFVAAFYFGLSYYSLLYTLPVLLAVFVKLIQKHSQSFDKRTHLENLIRIHEHELKALDGDFSVFPDGAEFINTSHPYTHDLDIFGAGSLFQFVNRSTTHSGKKLLAERLSGHMPSVESIVDHQNAVLELSAKTDFRQEIQACGMETEELATDNLQLREWMTHSSFVYGKNLYRYLLIFFPVVTVGLLGLAFFVDGVTPFFWLCAIFQWGFLGFHLKKVNAFHQYISKKKNILERYSKLLRAIESHSFDSLLMTDLHRKAKNASDKLQSLASWVGAFDARLNSMTNLFSNSLLMFDLQCVYQLEKWKEENAGMLEQWLYSIRETEALCSLGTLTFNNADFRFPKVNNNQILSATELGHPLIAATERVTNGIELNSTGSILIITGANMAGKSTFLRTIGVNVVLALAGAPVCAHDFNCPLISIRTGMRTADSLKDHQSYFYAELNRLKSIVDELKAGKELLILLDEILKGTNSTDKLAGSIALVKQFLDQPALVLVATHDLALGNLEKEHATRVRNFCFEPSIENDQLSFDYKLKTGLAQKMNATFLMKKMGIIPS